MVHARHLAMELVGVDKSRRVSREACSCYSHCSLSHIRLASGALFRSLDTVRALGSMCNGKQPVAPGEYEVLCETSGRAFCLDMCLCADGCDRQWSCPISLAFLKGYEFPSSFCPSLDAFTGDSTSNSH